MPNTCLLLSSPRLGRTFPRGVMSIASYLEAHGYPTTVLPLAYSLDPAPSSEGLTLEHEKQIEARLAAAVQRTHPTVVGIGNPYTLDFPDCLKILAICKRLDAGLTTVIGGPHVTFQDVECLQAPQVDVVVRGEGEWTMLDLMTALEQGRHLSSVAGISFRQDGQIVRTPARPLGDLGEFQPLNFGLLPADYMRQALVYGISSRGCAYRCSYCVERAFWQRWRPYPISRLVDEIETLAHQYDNQMLGFFESMIDTRTSPLFALCSALTERGLSLRPDFYLHVRADRITTDSVAAMRRAGIGQVDMGVESVSPRVLAMMDRTVTAEQVAAACRLLRAGGIKVHTYWIVGHPGDTPEESDNSFRFLKYLLEHDLTQTAEVMIFQPYPGTCFFEEPAKYGVEILHRDWSKWKRFRTHPPSQLTDFSADEIYAAWERFNHLLTTWQRLPHLNRRAFAWAPVSPDVPD